MSDIFDALLNGDNVPVDNADLVARLRQQKQLGQIAQLTGIAGLQKLGPTLQSEADQEAEDVYAKRENSKIRSEALAQAATLANEREADRLAIAQGHRDDMAQGRALTQALSDQRIDAGKEKVSDANAVKGQGVIDKATAAEAGIDKTLDAVDRVARHPGLGGNYGYSGMVANLPGGDAANAKALLDGLIAQEGLQGMSDMRAQGGTFGRTTNIEFTALKNAIAPLEDRHQNVNQVQQTLAKYRTQLLQAKQRIHDAAAADAAAYTAGPSVTVTQGFHGGSALPLSRGATGARTAAVPAAETYEQKKARLGL